MKIDWLLLCTSLSCAQIAMADDCSYNMALGCWGFLGLSVFQECPNSDSMLCGIEGNLLAAATDGFLMQMRTGARYSPDQGFAATSGGAGSLSGSPDSCCPDDGAPPTYSTYQLGSGAAKGPGCCSGGYAGPLPKSTGMGMAVWSVTEPRLDFWLQDLPVWYRPAIGATMSYRLTYKHLQRPTLTNVFGFGPWWMGNVCSYATKYVSNTIPYIAVCEGDGSTIVYDLKKTNVTIQVLCVNWGQV